MPILRLAELRNSRKEQYPVGVTIPIGGSLDDFFEPQNYSAVSPGRFISGTCASMAFNLLRTI